MPTPKTFLSPVIIGRAREMEILDRALHAVQNGNGTCVFLSGEAGIGKSRLAAELGNHATAAHFLILRGYCSEQDISFPYAPWIDALRAFLAPRSSAEANELLGTVAPEFVKLLPELSLLIPAIQPTPPLDPTAEKHRLFEVITRFAVSLAVKQPLLIILEDLHWSDDTSLELLQFLSRRIVSQPILVVATYREEEIPASLARILSVFDRNHLALEVHLQPLSDIDSISMVRNIVQHGRQASRELLDFVLTYAQGNPFYIEELIKLHDDPGSKQPLTGLPIPRSLRDTIHWRVLRLSPGAQRIIAIGAVIGKHFHFSLLSELAHLPEPDLLLYIHELIDASLCVETGVDEFSFRHGLIREAIYASLLIQERQELHRQIALTIEKGSQERAENDIPELAYHYYEAGDMAKALDYAQAAGQRAISMAALREALVQFNRAVDASRRLGVPPTWQTLLARGNVYDRLGDRHLALLDMTAALEQARADQDRYGESETLVSLGFFFSGHDYHRSIDYFQQALEAARAICKPALIAATLNRIGNWLVNQERPLEAEPYHKEALEIYEELQDQKGIASTLELIAMQTYFIGDILQGSQICEKALSLFRSISDREGTYYGLANSILCYWFDTDVTPLRDPSLLIERGEEALQIARSIGWYAGEADVLHVTAMVAGASGKYEIALNRERLAASMFEEINQSTGLVRSLMNLGAIYLDLFVFEDAIQTLERALIVSQETGYTSMAIIISGLLAQAHLERNNPDDIQQADQILQASLITIQALPAHTRHERYYWFAKARLELALGRAKEALEIAGSLLTSTLNIAVYGTQGVPRLGYLLGDCLAASGRIEDARSMYSSAGQGASQQGRQGILLRTFLSQGNLARSQKQWAEADTAYSEARRLIEQLADPISDQQIQQKFLQRGLGMVPILPAAGVKKAEKHAFGNLTGREREVAGLIAEGRSNREIAEKLFITERTTERHVSNILLKLNFHSRAQIAQWISDRRVRS